MVSSVCLLTSGQSAVLFSDGFESSNLAAWTVTGSPSVSGSMKNSGTNSARFTGAGPSCLIAKPVNFTSGYLRFYIYFDTGFWTQQKSNWKGIGFLKLLTADNKTGFSLEGYKNTRGKSAFFLAASPDGAWDYQESAVTPVENTWYCIELYIPERGTTAGIRWWINGTEEKGLGTNFASYTQPWEKIVMGLPNSTKYNSSVYLDDVVLSDDYSGPLGYATTPPAAPASVRDGVTLDVNATTATNQVSGNWEAVAHPVTRYWYAVGTTAGGTDVVKWTNNGISQRFTKTGVNLARGVKYYVSVKAENKAGMGPVASSDGATAGDSTVLRPVMTPNPLISRGKPVFASTDGTNASKLTDGRYDPASTWNAGQSGWAAIKVGAGYSRLMLIWDCNKDQAYNSPYNQVVFHEPPVSPADYTIQTSADSTNGSDGTWSTVVTSTNNIFRNREHSFDFSGKSWVKMNITKPVSTADVQISEIDIHDVSKGAMDTWMFIGDSITQRAFRRRPVKEQPSFAEIIHATHPDYFPAMINAGIGGDEIHDCWGVSAVSYKHLKHAGDIHLYLEQNPDIRFWCIGFGTNDWWEQGDGLTTVFKKVYQEVITEILKAGRIPIIAQVPFAGGVEDPKHPYRNIPTCLNPALQELTAENKLIPGPDLYNYFKSNRWFLGGDSVHPSIAGCNAMNAMWANLVTDFYANPKQMGDAIKAVSLKKSK